MPRLVVSLILDPAFGIRLANVLRDSFVWIVDSLDNARAVESCREMLKQKNDARPDPLTTFRIVGSPADSCLEVLPTIEDHHAWTTLDVYGVQPSPELEAILQGYGVKSISSTSFGFTASR